MMGESRMGVFIGLIQFEGQYAARTCVDLACVGGGSVSVVGLNILRILADLGQPSSLINWSHFGFHPLLSPQLHYEVVFLVQLGALGLADHVVLLGCDGWIGFLAAILFVFDRSGCGFGLLFLLVGIFWFDGDVFGGFLFDGRSLSFFEVAIKVDVG